MSGLAGRRGVIERAPQDPDQAAIDGRIREMLAAPDPGPIAQRLVLVHFRGRRTGRNYEVLAGLHRLDGGFFLATSARWRHNFTDGLDAELTRRGQQRTARLRLVDDPDRVAHGYWELVRRYGQTDAPRRLGVEITVDRTPDLAEVREAVDACGLALVEVRFTEGDTE